MKTRIVQIVIRVIAISIGLFLSSSCTEEVVEQCHEPSFLVIPNEYRTQYTLLADFFRRDEAVYAWFLDGDPVVVDFGNFGPTRLEPHKLIVFNMLGSHEVCIETNVSTECQGAKRYCQTVDFKEVPVCQRVKFVTEKGNTGPNQFLFRADFSDKETIDYAWYINDQLIEQELVGDLSTDHQMYQDYGSAVGVIEVCLRSIAPSCPESTTFCETIVLDAFEQCPVVTWYYIEQDPPGSEVYKVYVDFPGIADYPFQWLVNGVPFVIEEGVNGSEREAYIISELGLEENVICLSSPAFICPEIGGSNCSNFP